MPIRHGADERTMRLAGWARGCREGDGVKLTAHDKAQLKPTNYDNMTWDQVSEATGIKTATLLKRASTHNLSKTGAAMLGKPNVKDGTWRTGSKHPRAKVPTETVEALRVEYEAGGIGYLKLGKKYGVDWRTVCDIVKYRTRVDS